MRTYKTTYTKHYYIEGERICSKIGGGFQWAHTPPTSNPIDFIEGNPHTCSMHLREMVDRNTQCAEYDGEMDIRPELAPAHNNGNEYENLQYFYHPDHLGSASFVTDREGAVCQHIQYLPFGELFVSQRNCEFDSRYKFTAKELDNETSYTYFGARYYDSDLSGWLSVDPMSDERRWVSPYSYCQNNPVMRVDPTGALDGDFYDQKGKYLGTDGIDDGKVYVVTNKDEAKAIKKTDKSGGTTNSSDVSSAVTLPRKSVRLEMLKVVDEDKKDPFREYGGIFGTDASGNEKVIWAKPGDKADPSKVPEATMDIFDAANPDEKGTLITYSGTFHSHPSGSVSIGPPSEIGMETFGGTTMFYFRQTPSNRDIQAAAGRTYMTGNNYVLVTGNNTVYIYNGNGVQATFPLDKLGTVGK